MLLYPKVLFRFSMPLTVSLGLNNLIAETIRSPILYYIKAYRPELDTCLGSETCRSLREGRAAGLYFRYEVLNDQEIGYEE